jgi:hypothetical protein
MKREPGLEITSWVGAAVVEVQSLCSDGDGASLNAALRVDVAGVWGVISCRTRSGVWLG